MTPLNVALLCAFVAVFAWLMSQPVDGGPDDWVV